VQRRFLVLHRLLHFTPLCKCVEVLTCEQIKFVRSVGLQLFSGWMEIFQEKTEDTVGKKANERVAISLSQC